MHLKRLSTPFLCLLIFTMISCGAKNNSSHEKNVQPAAIKASISNPNKITVIEGKGHGKKEITRFKNPIIKEVTEQIGAEEIKLKLTYFLDSIYHFSARSNFINVRDIKVEQVGETNLSESLVKGVKRAFSCYLNYERLDFKKVISRKDFNFDGHPDISFIGEGCFAQNNTYEVYLFDPQEQKYSRSETFSELFYSKLELNEASKELTLYYHLSSTEGSKSTFKLDNQGQLKMVKKQVTFRRRNTSGKYGPLSKITGEYKNGKWQEDTIIIAN